MAVVLAAAIAAVGTVLSAWIAREVRKVEHAVDGCVHELVHRTERLELLLRELQQPATLTGDYVSGSDPV